MAIIQCPECGAEISEKASACPECGKPIGFQCESCGHYEVTLLKRAPRDPEALKRFGLSFLWLFATLFLTGLFDLDPDILGNTFVFSLFVLTIYLGFDAFRKKDLTMCEHCGERKYFNP